jgi:hypothetical protein
LPSFANSGTTPKCAKKGILRPKYSIGFSVLVMEVVFGERRN